MWRFTAVLTVFLTFPAIADVKALVWPNHKNIQAALLNDGTQSLQQRKSLIRLAKTSIYYKSYEFFGDATGQMLAAELIQRRVKDNLDIQIAVDAFPAWLESNRLLIHNTRIMVQNLMAAGIRVLGATCGNKLQFRSELSLQSLPFINFRNHAKAMVIDHLQETTAHAIVGGMNTANSYFHIGSQKWSDADILLLGKVAQDIGQSFFVEWHFRALDDTSDTSCMNPYAVGSDAYLEFYYANTTPYHNPSDTHNRRENLLAKLQLNSIDENLDTPPAPPIFHLGSAQFIESSPLEGQVNELNLIENKYVELIDNAQKEILISNIYFIPSKRAIHALRAARARGVNITIITNSPASNPQRSAVCLSQYSYAKLFRKIPPGKIGTEPGSIRIFEYDGSFQEDKELKSLLRKELDAAEKDLIHELYPHLKIHKRVGHALSTALQRQIQGSREVSSLLHAKYAVFDGQRSIVGSYNLDPRSRKFNKEYIIVFNSKDFAQELIQTLQRDTQRSRELTATEIESLHRPWNPISWVRLGLAFCFKRYL